MISKTLKWTPDHRVDVFSKVINGRELVFIRTTKQKEFGVAVERERLERALKEEDDEQE